MRDGVSGQVMAITDLKAHLSSSAPEQGTGSGRLAEKLAALEAEFRLLREECVRTRKLIEDRESKGRTLIDAYKQVISDFTNLFEAQRKENLKREESISFLLSSIESRMKSEVERISADDQQAASPAGRKLFRRR